MSSTSNRRRGARLVAGAGVAALAAMALAAPAFAAPEFGNINPDPDATGTITLHKHEHQVGTAVVGDPEAGTTLDNPIAGVNFTAYPLTHYTDADDATVAVEVHDPATWDALAAIDLVDAVCPVPNTSAPAAALDGWTLGAGIPFGATTGTGATPALEVDLGAYLICETGFDTALVNVTSPAQPFVITVPFPDNQTGAPSNSNGWLYDVHAYPKNTLAADIGKSIDEQVEFGLGAEVSFPVTTSIPRLSEDEQFTRYTVVDPMDPRLTDLDVASVQLNGADIDADHYDLIFDRNVVMVHFNQAGLAWLKTQGGEEVVTVFTGTVSSLSNDDSEAFGLDDGEIYNKAYLVTDNETRTDPPTTPEEPQLPPVDPEDPDKPVDPNEPWDPEEEEPPSVPSNEVTSNWGDVQAFKFDADDDDEAPLSGAVFEVYAASDAYADVCGTAYDDADLVEVNGATRFTSVDGLVSIAGLFVNDSVNSPLEGHRCYVLVEVQAPAGFVTPTGDSALTALTVVTGSTDIDLAYDAEIGNTKQSMPELPLTGAQGQLLLMILGAGLVLGGVIAATVSARKRRARELS